MNPFLAANAVANPGQYAQTPVNGEESGTIESPLSSGGVGVNALNNLGGLAELLGGNNMSSSQDFSSGLGSIDFSNPYVSESGPVAGRQPVDYGSQPVLNPVNNTYRAPSPTAGVTGGQEFDYFGNRVSNSSNPFTLGEGTAGLFTANGTNMGDYVNSALKSTFGDFYNEDFSTGKGAQYGVGSYGEYAAPNRAFSFGDTSLGQYGAQELGISRQDYGRGMGALGELGKFSAASGNYDTANKFRAAQQLLSLNGNNTFDSLATLSNNKYAGYASLLNDDWSPRATMSKALSIGNVPYAGSIMAGMDYAQGKNNYGALGQGIGMLAGFNPLVSYGLGLAGDWLGDKYGNDWNENRVGPGREWAESQGLEVGRPGYDKALNAWDKAAKEGKLTEDQQFFIEDWNNDIFDPSFLEQNMLGGSTINDPKSVFVAPETLQEAIEYKEKFGQEGDESWTPGGGKTFHSDKFNWNGMEQNRAETAAEAANELIRVEENRVQAEKVAAAQRQAEAAAAQRMAAQRAAADKRLAESTYDPYSDFGSDNFSGPGGTDSTGATASDYSSYDNPDESSGPSSW